MMHIWSKGVVGATLQKVQVVVFCKVQNNAKCRIWCVLLCLYINTYNPKMAGNGVTTPEPPKSVTVCIHMGDIHYRPAKIAYTTKQKMHQQIESTTQKNTSSY